MLLERRSADDPTKTTSHSSMKSSSKHGGITNRCWKLRCPNLHSPSMVARASHSMVMMVVIHSRAHLPSKVLVAIIPPVRTAFHQVRSSSRRTLSLTHNDRLSHAKATVSTPKRAATVFICRSSTAVPTAAITISNSRFSQPNTIR